MKKMTAWLITASILIFIGGLIFVGVMTVINWDFFKLDISKFETNNYVITEETKNITVITKTANVKILPSDNGEFKVECYENVKVKHTVSNENGNLKITIHDERKWYDHIKMFSFKTPKVTVYLPENEYGELFIKGTTGGIYISDGLKFDRVETETSTGRTTCYADVKNALKIKVTTGGVFVENINVGSLDVWVSTGYVKMSSVNCENELSVRVSTGETKMTAVRCEKFTSKGSTGSIVLTDVIATGMINIKRSTGDIRLNECDAESLELKTDTGDINGTLLTDKVFVYKTDTGDVKLPQTTRGGVCKIETDTGNIRITICG